MATDFDEPRFDQLPAFPADTEPPLPPPKPWHRRLPSLLWRLFPATIVCVPLFGVIGFLFLGIVDPWLGFLGGIAIGAFSGFVNDGRRWLGGETIDD